MKKQQLAFLSAILTGSAIAQTPVSPSVVIEETVIETSPGSEVQAAQRRLDAALARERLGIAPVVVPAPAPMPDATPAPLPGVVEQTTTTTTVEEPGLPPRVYSTERNVVIVEGREMPYLTIPVLFVEGSAELLDAESGLAIGDTAAAIKDVLIANPTAVFDVEGHTSTDGEEAMNMQLSADRSRRIYTELIENYGVPTSALAAHGYGENYPKYPEGTEQEMILDRRVLVVRVK